MSEVGTFSPLFHHTVILTVLYCRIQRRVLLHHYLNQVFVFKAFSLQS